MSQFKQTLKTEIYQFEMIAPIIVLLFLIIATPIEANFSTSLAYFMEKPVTSIFSVLLFGFAIPRAGFMARSNTSSPTPFQKKVLLCMTLVALIVAFFLLK